MAAVDHCEYPLKAEFTIENKVLKGLDKPIHRDVCHLGDHVLSGLNNDLNHVYQIDAETGEQTTFADIKDRSIRCALWLKKQGLSSNDIVAVCTHNHLNTCVPVLGTLLSGAIYSGWSHESTLDFTRSLMKQFAPKIIFACESAADTLKKASMLENVKTQIVIFGKHSDFQTFDNIMQIATMDEIKNFVISKKDPKETAIIFLTSGTTGVPKGVMFSTEAILQKEYLYNFSLRNKRVLSFSTLYWLSGFFMIFSALFQRATRIIDTRMDVDNVCRTIAKFKVQFAFLTPIMLSYIAKSSGIENYNLRSLKIILTGGSKTSKTVIEIIQKRIPSVEVFQGHGLTETGDYNVCQTRQRKAFDSVGFILQNSQLKIIDIQSGKTLGSNEIGEICYKCPSMMLGYYKNLEATKKMVDKEGWVHTGDAAYYDSDGEIFYVERIENIIRYKNYQINPQELEVLLISHPAVVEVAVVPIPHEIDGEWPMAFVKKVPGSNVTEKELVDLSATLGDLKKLRGGVQFMESLPKTASVKIAKNVLKEIARSSRNT